MDVDETTNLKVEITFLKNKIIDFSKQFEKKLNYFDKDFNRKINDDIQYENLSDPYIAEYSSKNSKFIQYANSYFLRLYEIKPSLQKQVKEKWSTFKICENILDIKGKEDQIIIGVLYKEMPMKPSILKGIETILGSKKVENFVNEVEDYLVLEDNSGRIRISNNSRVAIRDFSPSYYITGIVAAIKGRLDDKGLLIMEDILFNRVSNYSLPKRIQSSINFEDSYKSSGSLYNILQNKSNIIAFISGLQFGNTDYSGKSQLSRNLLIDFFQGRFSNDEMVLNMIKRINRVIIVGDSINSPDDTDLFEKGSFMKQDLNSRVMRILLKNYEEFDEFLNILSNSVSVDVMPGLEDNSSSFFPQLPLNQIMFQNCSLNDSVNFVPNPYSFKLDDLLFTGTSGQNIKNIQQYTKISESAIDIMEKTLEWNHFSPSAPDTIRTYPITDKDPLIIENVPNVYFAGNAKNFETRLSFYNQIPLRLISIPQFCTNHSIVLLDLSSLEVCEYNFEFLNS